MSTVHHPSGGFPLDPQSEVNELRDIGARDLSPTPSSPVAANDIERIWADEIQRGDPLRTCPEGHRNVVCEACGCGPFVPVGEAGDVLCPKCLRAGEALATDSDDEPRPPTAGAIQPDYPWFATLAARLSDDQLCEAIGVADAEPDQFRLLNLRQREAFIGAFSAEVVRRLSCRLAA